MTHPRSLQTRLAMWYSALLMAGLLALGGALWAGVSYSMTAAVDDQLRARIDNLGVFMDKEFGTDFPDWGAKTNGEVKAEVEAVDPAGGWFTIRGERVALTDETDFEGFGSSPLAAGQFIETAVKLDGGSWRAVEVSRETSFDDVFQEELAEYASASPDGRLLEVQALDGEVLLRSSGSPHEFDAPMGSGLRFDSVGTEQGPFRRLAGAVSVAGGDYHVFSAASLAGLAATQQRLMQWLLWAIPLGLALSLGGGYVIGRAALGPVERVAAAAERADVHQLSERIEVPSTGDVVERLATTFNAMLGRLEGSVARLEEFTADVSHELRSPVSIIRTTSELALRKPRGLDDLRDDMREIHDEAERLTEMIEDLLTLARADSGAEETPREPVDLANLALETTAPYQRSLGGRILSLDLPDNAVVVAGYPGSLRRLLVILLENAIRHTTDEAAIGVTVRQEGHKVSLAVTDSGVGIDPEHLPRIFDRFYRADSSRNRSSGGFGLGLSIAKWIAESHGGSLTATSEPGRGSTFEAILPRSAGTLKSRRPEAVEA